MNKSNEDAMSDLLDRDVSAMLLIGSEGDEDESATDEDSDDLQDDGDGDPKGDKSKDGDGTEDDGQEDDAATAKLKRTITNLEEERGRNADKRVAAEKRAEKAEGELAALKASGAGEPEAKQALATLTEEANGLRDRVHDMALENAFLKDNGHEWQDASAALRLADLKGVEIDEDGSVHGLDLALEKLAKASPWLLREAKTKTAPKKSGSPSGSKTNQQKSGDAERKRKYTSKYPGLRR